MTNTSPFLWNGSSKIPFFTDIWYSFFPRLLRPANLFFFKLVDETLMSKPLEATRHHKSIKLLILLPLRADLLCILQYETPCKIIARLRNRYNLKLRGYINSCRLLQKTKNFDKVCNQWVKLAWPVI